jgi:hypothetical protein
MKTDDNHPLVGHSYAILTGTYVGEIFVYISETKLLLPSSLSP